MQELTSKRLYFRTLTEDDATSTYADWLNNPVVNRFLEVRHTRQDIETCRAFIRACNADSGCFLFGIFVDHGKSHIGNIKLGPIDWRNKSGQIGLLIGDQSCWGAGYGSEAISAITRFSFNEQGLNRLEAGCYEENLGSLRAFLRSGYYLEGFFRKKYILDGKRTGCFWLAILKDEWENNQR